MTRIMSFALTERQLLDGSKTVTRRLGWAWLVEATAGGPVGLVAVRKAMGLKPGETVVRLREIQVVAATRVRIGDITPADVLAEGFPAWTSQVDEFVRMFCRHMRVTADAVVTRIEFKPGKLLVPQLTLPGGM